MSDLNKHYYETLNLTVAQHPSETVERMMVRVLVFCVNAAPDLELTKGLSEVDEPDLWSKALDDSIKKWIEVGEPDPERIKKASRKAEQVLVYSFNTKSDVWWKQSADKFKQLNAEYFQLQWTDVSKLCSLVERNMECSITISEDSAYVAAKSGECNLTWKTLE